MLSENLELRGQILRLEKEVENSKAQRVADHALEIKAKLEAQLVEWGGLLAGLGLEPPVKRQDAVGRRMSQSQSRGSLGRRSPRKSSLRDLAREAEARAREEGRLTPIAEHKAYPRRTLDSEGIMALRNEAAADISSSDIGSPPTSRFAETNSPRKEPDSPSKLTQTEEVPESIPESPLQKMAAAVKEEEIDTPLASALSAIPQAEAASMPHDDIQVNQPAKAGSKRKLAARDEPQNATPAVPAAASTTTTTRRKSTILKERTAGKTLKEITEMRREERVKQAPAAAPDTAPDTAPDAAPTLRKPLGAKSTNDDLTSPKKAGKKAAAPTKPLRSVKMKPLPEKQPRESAKRKVMVMEERPVLPPAETDITIADLESEPKKPSVTTAKSAPTPTTVLETNPLSPTPEPKPMRSSRDTPPPADMSLNGETSRPSRRVRAQVSYAEPNLRDKMRRPTKELVDAVTVDTKSRRPESLATDEIAAMVDRAKLESVGMADVFGDVPPSSSSKVSVAVTAAAASTLAQEGMGGGGLPSNVVTERRKRRSSVLAREFSTGDVASDKSISEGDDNLDISLSSTSTTESSGDIYDFPTNSPEMEAAAEEHPTRKPSNRRASRAGQADASRGEEPEPRVSRKRASISLARRSRLEGMAEVGGEGSADTDGPADRPTRRRSTMI
ncbi:uncharacterized protein DNG_06603 [Cephalotrichum gorgonifer]|uniref:Shugoshin C-terminal domain-containing protein n=1 Tax=Cephalotrichum gorgonifer TaxID=2041049 RepID=A0AAE8N074_9PEZI|nr:uncharacterized protein DNG_06603 [Cephalotrichum gorgonifer]